MWTQKIKRFFIRVLIYQIIILWSFTKLNHVEKHSGEFKNKVLANFNYFGINNKDLAEIIEDPIILLCYSALEVLAGIFGIFGSHYGHIVSATLFLITNLIYFNPLFQTYNISLFKTRPEIFYNIGIFLSLLLLAYYPEVNSKSKAVQANEDETSEDEGEDRIITAPVKQSQVNNKSKKKKN